MNDLGRFIVCLAPFWLIFTMGCIKIRRVGKGPYSKSQMNRLEAAYAMIFWSLVAGVALSIFWPTHIHWLIRFWYAKP